MPKLLGKSVISWIIPSLVALIFMCLGIYGLLNGKTIMFNLENSNLYQSILYDRGTIGAEILRDDPLKFEFKANFNNLGEVQFLLDNRNMTTPDMITFRIREKGSDNWYSENSYDTSTMKAGYYYPFGFPFIKNSKGKTYEIEITSVNGSIGNSLLLENTTNFYQAIYNFPLSYLRQNKEFIPTFVYWKAVNYLSLLNFKDLLFLTIWLLMSIGIARRIKQIFREFRGLRKDKLSIINIILRNGGILLLLIVYVLSHIQFLSYSQYWDADVVYGVVRSSTGKFFDFVHFIDNFNVTGHPSVAYTSLMSISQDISYNSHYLLNIENLVLAVLAIWAFYKIFLYLFGNRKLEATLVTSVFAFNPLFYATSINLNFDFPVLVFGILALYSFLYKKPFMLIFWSILMVFSKETGLFLYGTFVGISFLVFDLRKVMSGVEKINFKKYAVFIIPIFLYVLYLACNSWQLWSNQGCTSIVGPNSIVWSNGKFCFSIDTGNIVVRIVELFIMNFNWILSLIITIACIKSFVCKRDLFDSLTIEKRRLVIAFMFTMLIFILFNFFYIVMPFPRYVVENTFFLIILSYICLNYLTLGHYKLKITLLTLLVILFSVQTFKDIDPSIKIIFGRREMAQNETSPFFGMADGLVYNAQFAYLDKLSDLILKETRGSILVGQDWNGYFFKNIPFEVRVKNINELKNPDLKRVIYVYFPWFSKKENDFSLINKYYSIKYIDTVSAGGYYAELYLLTK